MFVPGDKQLRHGFLDQILNAYEEFGEMERYVLHCFAMRLWAGQKAYGMLSPNKRNWKQETFEEALDASVYLCCDMAKQTGFTALRTPTEPEGI